METKANDLIHSYEGEKSANFRGLTKREMFAAFAMQGDCASLSSDQLWSNESLEIRSKDWVKMADALIKALNEKGE